MKFIRHKSRLLRLLFICILIFGIYYFSRNKICEISFHLSLANSGDCFGLTSNVKLVNTNKNDDVDNIMKHEAEARRSDSDPIPVVTKVAFDPKLPELRKKIIRILNQKQEKNFDNSEHSIYTNKKLGQIPNTSGYLNRYTWPDVCSWQISSLKARLDFPFNPWIKQNTANISSIRITKKDIAMRLFGYIKPPSNGRYRILIRSNSTVEAWLSPDQYPENANRIWFEENEFTHELKKYQLHYFEVMYVSNPEYYKDTISILWFTPQSGRFEEIPSEYLIPYVEENLSIVIPETYHPENPHKMHILSQDLASKLYQTENGAKYEYHSYRRFPIINVDAIGHNLRYKCNYIPYFIEKLQINKTDDLTYSKHSRFYPPYPPYLDSVYRRDHIYIDPVEASNAAVAYFKFMQRSYEMIIMHKIMNVEKLEDPENGHLYFVQLQVLLAGQESLFTMLDFFVIEAKNSEHKICFPNKMIIHMDTFIHVQVTHRNFPTMMRYFVENWEMIYEITGDENFDIIVINFPSPLLDVERLLRQSKLKRWRLIELKDPFSKVAAINLGLDSVTNPDDIIFTTDLSLHHPPSILDSIRKHTFKGYSAYGPIAFYHGCQMPNVNSKLFYSDWGFGLIAFHKSDWDELHGMNTEKFGLEWGFEDNDIALRIIKSGYLLIRIDMRGFFHQYHSYHGLWEFPEENTVKQVENEKTIIIS